MIDADDDNNNPSSHLIEKSTSLSRSQADHEQHVASSYASSYAFQERLSHSGDQENDRDDDRSTQILPDMQDFIFEDGIILDDIELLVDIYLLFENSRWILKTFLW